MRICMIVHAYYLKDARVRRYAEILVNHGAMVDVLCLREGNEAIIERHDGVTIHRVNLTRQRGGAISYVIEYIDSFVRFFWKLNKLHFSGNHYDVIHIHNFPNFLIFTTIIQKISGAKLILDVHDPMPELFRSKFKVTNSHPLIRMLYLEERLSLSFSNYIIAANHVFKELLVERGCPEGKVEVVINAPDKMFYVDPVEMGGSGKKTFNVLYIGTLAERYGLDTALEAVAKISKNNRIPGIKFTIIPKIKNEGDYLKKILEKVELLKLQDLFTMLDPVSLDKMPQIIQEADLLVYTPLPDVHMDIALSLKIPEVIAVGRPIVASRLSVLEKYFGDDSIYYCKPGDHDDCADKILQVWQYPEEAQLRVFRAKEHLKKLEWEKQKEVYLKVIAGLSAEKE